MRRFRSAFEFARSSSRECLRRYGLPVLSSAKSLEDESGRGINGFTAAPTGEEAILEFRLFKQFCEPSEPTVGRPETRKRRGRTMSETEVRLRRPTQSANPTPSQTQPEPIPPPAPRCPPSPNRRTEFLLGKASSSSSSGRSSAKLRDCTVVLLDGSEAPFKIDPSSRCQALFDMTCEFLCLTERQYFGLCYKDPTSGAFEWLYNDKRLSRQLDPNGASAPWRVDFSVKFYPLKPETLTDAQARSCLALQVRQNLIAGRLPCSFTGYALLGSYLMQTDLGDWVEGNERAAIGCQFCPDAALRADPNLLRQARQLHQCHLGLASRDAERRLLENARKLATYGLDVHEAASGGETHLVGVCGDGFVLMRPEGLLRTARFTWPRVTALTRRGREVCVTLRQAPGGVCGSAGTTMVRLRCTSLQLAQRLWRSAVEHHGFFRLKARDMTTAVSRPLIQSGSVRISRSISQSYAASTGSLEPEECVMVPIQKRASSLNRYRDINVKKTAVLVSPEDIEDSVRLDGPQNKEASVRSNLKLLTATDQKAALRQRSSSRRSCTIDDINGDVQLRVLPKEALTGKRNSAVAVTASGKTDTQQCQLENPKNSSVFLEPNTVTASDQAAPEAAETEAIATRSDCAINKNAVESETKAKKKKKKHRHRKERQSDSEDKPKKSSRSKHPTKNTSKSKQAATDNQLQLASQFKQKDPEYQSQESQKYQQNDPEYQSQESQKYQQKDPEYQSQESQKYQQNNPEYQSQESQKYQQNDPEYQSQRSQKYQQNDPEYQSFQAPYQPYKAYNHQQEDLEYEPHMTHRYQHEDSEYKLDKTNKYQQKDLGNEPHKTHQYQQKDSEYEPHEANQYQQKDSEYEPHEANQYRQEDSEYEPYEANQYQKEDSEYGPHEAHPYQQEDSDYEPHEANQYQQEDSEYEPHEASQYQREDSEYEPHEASQYQREDSEYEPHEANQYQQEDSQDEPHEANQYQREDSEYKPNKAKNYQQEDSLYESHESNPQQLDKTKNLFDHKEHCKQCDKKERNNFQGNVHQQQEYPDQTQLSYERQQEFFELQAQISLQRQDANLDRQSTAVENIDNASGYLGPERHEANISAQKLLETTNQKDSLQTKIIKPHNTEYCQETQQPSLEDRQKLQQQQIEPPPLLTPLSSPTRRPPSGEETPDSCDTASGDQAFFRTSAFAADATVEAASVRLVAGRQPNSNEQLLTLLDAMKKSAGNATTSAVKNQVANSADEETNRVSIVETMTETTETDAPVEELISFTDHRGNQSVRRVVRHRKIRVIVTDTIVESPLSTSWHSHPDAPRSQTHSSDVNAPNPHQRKPKGQTNIDEGYV